MSPLGWTMSLTFVYSQHPLDTGQEAAHAALNWAYLHFVHLCFLLFATSLSTLGQLFGIYQHLKVA